MTAANGARARIGILAVSLAVLVSVPLDLVPLLRGPAPYPPEWQWAFRPDGPARPLFAAAAVALALLGLVWCSGTSWARRRPRVAGRVLVAGAVLLGLAFQVTLLAREPGNPLRTLMSRARSRSFTSYYNVAVSPETRDPVAFLRQHAGRLPEYARSAKHAATHPPGPVLFYRSALAVCEASPALANGLLRAAGVPDRDFRPPDTRAARAAALLGALVLAVLGALTAWPVWHLARALGVEEGAATRLALLWALLPGPALMTPQFDQALALPLAGATLLLLRGWSGGGRGLGAAGGAGLLGGVALLTSYGAAVFLAIAGITALSAAGDLRRRWRRAAPAVAVAAGVGATVAFGLPALLGHQPVRALLTALSIHREMYTAPRSYVLWLIFNPVDLAVFLGLPVAGAGIAALLATRRGEDPLSRFRRAAFGGLALLLLLGVTRGEVGRLWIPLMPLLLVASSRVAQSPRRRDTLVGGALLAALALALGAYWIT